MSMPGLASSNDLLTALEVPIDSLGSHTWRGFILTDREYWVTVERFAAGIWVTSAPAVAAGAGTK
jgi:hypothetical protein